MKAKTPTHGSHRNRHNEPVPHELGRHLFALIKRNLLAQREGRSTNTPPSQMTFAF
jgi:hypothetical protein